MSQLLVDRLRQQLIEANNRAERYGLEARDLTVRLMAAEQHIATLTQERDRLLIAREDDRDLFEQQVRANLSLEAKVATLTVERDDAGEFAKRWEMSYRDQAAQAATTDSSAGKPPTRVKPYIPEFSARPCGCDPGASWICAEHRED